MGDGFCSVTEFTEAVIGVKFAPVSGRWPSWTEGGGGRLNSELRYFREDFALEGFEGCTEVSDEITSHNGRNGSHGSRRETRSIRSRSGHPSTAKVYLRTVRGLTWSRTSVLPMDLEPGPGHPSPSPITCLSSYR